MGQPFSQSTPTEPGINTMQHSDCIINSDDKLYHVTLDPPPHTHAQVNRHTVDMCGSYSSCDTCTSSPDPVCGWCVLQGRCTRPSLLLPFPLPSSLPLLLPGRPTETAGQCMSCGSNPRIAYKDLVYRMDNHV